MVKVKGMIYNLPHGASIAIVPGGTVTEENKKTQSFSFERGIELGR